MEKIITDVRSVEPILESGQTNSTKTDVSQDENGHEPNDNDIFYDLFESLGRNKNHRRKH